jgi:diguanylate cyclase (GGDEF)-like protein
MKICVAEDDPAHRQLLEQTLSHWDYTVITTADGESAWHVFEEPDGPQLALFDWRMPGLDGVQLCRRLRQRNDSRYVYVVILTAWATKQDVIQGLQAGADDFLIKPYEPEELRARLDVGRRLITIQNELVRAHEATRLQAMRDGLTGIWNRTAILEHLGSELNRAARGHHPVGILMADLDNFKQINDSHGHLTGDIVLQEATRRIQAAVRPYDMVGRYGGEEFLVVLPGCDREDARKIAERIRERLASEPIRSGNSPIGITVSLGGTVCWNHSAQINVTTLLTSADTALYSAKRAGRNRVEISTVG